MSILEDKKRIAEDIRKGSNTRERKEVFNKVVDKINKLSDEKKEELRLRRK